MFSFYFFINIIIVLVRRLKDRQSEIWLTLQVVAQTFLKNSFG